MLRPIHYVAGAIIGIIMIGFSSSFARAQYVGHVSSFVMDEATGNVLEQADADLQRYPASLTKLMTLYLTFKSLSEGRMTLSTAMPVSIHASLQAPSKLGLRPGTHLKVEQAILALTTKSANDAACVLGEYLGGGDEENFASEMTRQAHALGMSNTRFRNASGLPDPDQVTTSRDMARLAQHIIRDFPQYYHFFNVKGFYFRRHMIANHDPLLGLYAGADGLKTGYTDLAGHNLVSSAQQGKHRLIAVVLGAPSNESRNQTMISLLNQGFADEGQTPLPLMEAPKSTHPYQRHMRRGVVLVSYQPHRRNNGAHHMVVRHMNVSKPGHHRS